MSKEHPARADGPPGRPILPPEAEQEIMDMLSANMRISSGEIAAILKKHGVSGDADALQDSYRKRLGQRLMSSIRDENGRREVLARGSEYIVVECCSDQQQENLLDSIRALLREELGRVEFVSSKENIEPPQAGDVDDDVLSFLRSLQEDEATAFMSRNAG